MAVRSTLLGAGRVTTLSEKFVFTVPADTTVLVKSIYGYAYNLATGLLNVVMALPPAAGFAAVSIDVTQNKGWRWDGWLALDPGWRLSLYNGSPAACDYVISGTVLPGAALELPAIKPV